MVLIAAARTGYTPQQCGQTLTVGDLIDILSQYEEEDRVYISNDGGYTFGSIHEWDVDVREEEGTEE